MADTNGGMGMFGQEGSDTFFEDGLVADLVWAEFFTAPSGEITYKYIGTRAWAAVYLGTRSDSSLYLGSGTLHP